MSITQFFRILWARRMLIVLSTVGCLVLAGIAALVLPPRYEATSRVMLDIVKPDPVTGEAISSQWARAYVSTQVQLIQDYRVAERVADEAGWTQSPEMQAEYQDSGAQNDIDFRRWLAQRLIDRVEVTPVPATNILDIVVTSQSPEMAAQLADLVRKVYVETTLESRREAAQRNAEWFNGQTSEVREELATAEKNKNDYEREHGVFITPDNIDTDTARLTALAGSAPAASITAGGGGVSPSAAQLAQIDAAIASASRTMGPNHPALQQLQRQRSAIAQAAASEQAAMRPASSGPSLESLYSEQQARVLRNAGAADEARRLATDVAVLRDQYRSTAARAAALEQEAQSTESGLTLLGDAVIPQSVTFPNYPLMLIAGLVAGLGLGIVATLGLELLWRRVRSVEELRIFNVPVLGAMAEASDETADGESQQSFNFRPRFSAS